MVGTDCFKQVSERHGHSAGGCLLRQIGEALCSALRGNSHVLRLVVLANIDAPRCIAATQVTARVRSLEIEGFAEYGRPSVILGLALSAPRGAEDIEALIERADQTCARTSDKVATVW